MDTSQKNDSMNITMGAMHKLGAAGMEATQKLFESHYDAPIKAVTYKFRVQA